MNARSTNITWVVVSGIAAAEGVAVCLLIDRIGPLWAVVILLAVPAACIAAPAAAVQAARILRQAHRNFCWWHLLWLIAMISGFTFRIRSSETARDMPLDFWAAFRVLLSASVGLALLARLVRGKTNWLGTLTRGVMGAMALYCVVTVISSLWSIYPAWTLYRSVEICVDVALIAAILTQAYSPARFMALFNWQWLLIGVQLALVWIEAAIWPKEALLHGMGTVSIRVSGVFPAVASNGVGGYGALLGIVAVARLQGRAHRALYWFVLAASIVTMIFAQTRGAIIGFLVSTAIILYFSKRFKSLLVLSWVAIVLVAYTSSADVFWAFFQRGQSMHDLESLTGRVGWWTSGWNRYMDSPLTGFGAYTLRFAVLEQVGFDTTSSIHDSYLEVLFGTGPFGLMPFMIALCWTWSTLFRGVRRRDLDADERRWTIEIFAMLAFLTVGGISSSALVWHPAALNLLGVMGYAEALRRRRRARSRPVPPLPVSSWRPQPTGSGRDPIEVSCAGPDLP